LVLFLTVFETAYGHLSLKLSIENCGQTAVDGDMITTDSLEKVATALSDSIIADSLRFTVSPQYRTIGIA